MLYTIAQSIMRCYMKLFFKCSIVGLDNIDKNTNYILCANHKSNYDPILIAVFLPIKMWFLAKKQLFKNKLSALIARNLNCIPIDRGIGDTAAIKAALKVLKSGKNLLMFPEGTRNKNKASLHPAKTGAAMLALKMNTKILPIGINSDYKFGKRIILRIGKPIDLSSLEIPNDNDIYRYITDEIIMKQIYELKNDA